MIHSPLPNFTSKPTPTTTFSPIGPEPTLAPLHDSNEIPQQTSSLCLLLCFDIFDNNIHGPISNQVTKPTSLHCNALDTPTPNNPHHCPNTHKDQPANQPPLQNRQHPQQQPLHTTLGQQPHASNQRTTPNRE
ncbi:hypothetical protein V8G54_012162 [Vigna mungo]|uniref:Uncharacterized protein n=1 Tax=Vigna mungo TaxID=3915 RepID=A0AAQ3S3J5_VIGMU